MKRAGELSWPPLLAGCLSAVTGQQSRRTGHLHPRHEPVRRAPTATWASIHRGGCCNAIRENPRMRDCQAVLTLNASDRGVLVRTCRPARVVRACGNSRRSIEAGAQSETACTAARRWSGEVLEECCRVGVVGGQLGNFPTGEVVPFDDRRAPAVRIALACGEVDLVVVQHGVAVLEET
jgi:hypothetical protein